MNKSIFGIAALAALMVFAVIPSDASAISGQVDDVKQAQADRAADQLFVLDDYINNVDLPRHDNGATHRASQIDYTSNDMSHFNEETKNNPSGDCLGMEETRDDHIQTDDALCTADEKTEDSINFGLSNRQSASTYYTSGEGYLLCDSEVTGVDVTLTNCILIAHK